MLDENQIASNMEKKYGTKEDSNLFFVFTVKRIHYKKLQA